MRKVFVIGIDGATFRLIKPLIRRKKLPTFEKILENGVHGVLESSIPPVTYPAWKCYSTGKKPNKLDIYYFFKVDLLKRKVYPVSSIDFTHNEIWDYLSSFGIKVGIIEMPTTYPAKKVNGFMISGHLVTGDKYTYPSELKNLLKKKFGYSPSTPDKYATVNFEERLNDIRKLFDICVYLYKKENPQFVHLTIFDIDHIQHLLFKKYVEGNYEGKYLEKAWKLVDEKVSDLLEEIDEDTVVLFMSDHGFTKYLKTFNINVWLINNKYLYIKNDYYINILRRLGITKDRAVRILSRLRLLNVIRKIIPRKYRGKVPNDDQSLTFGFIGDNIIWNKTIAFGLGWGLVYINKSNVSPTDYNKIRERLREEFLKITDPKTNKTIFEKIYFSEEIFSENVNENTPDLVLIPKEGYLISDGISSNLWTTHSRWDGIHAMDGIFIAYGKDIRRGYKIEGAKIYDLAPTILHIFGLPIPNDMDGKVLMEIFEPDSEPAKRQPVYVDPSYYEAKGEKEKLKSKIRELKLKGKLQ